MPKKRIIYLGVGQGDSGDPWEEDLFNQIILSMGIQSQVGGEVRCDLMGGVRTTSNTRIEL